MVSFPKFRHEPPPRLRVQIWYNSSVGGVSEKINRELVQSLPTTMRGKNEMDWVIKPREYLETPDDMSKRFVPMELEMHYPPTGTWSKRHGPADQTARHIFYETLLEHISAFMQQRNNRALYITMHPDPIPLKKELPLKTTLKYCQVQVENSLALVSIPLAQSSIPRTNPGLDTAAQLLPRVVVTVNQIYKRIEGLAAGIKEGNVATELGSFIRDAISSATLAGLDDAFEQSNLRATEEIKKSWTKTLVSAGCFRTLTYDVKKALKVISDGEKILDGSLHNMVTEMVVASVLFGEYEKEMEVLCKLLETEYRGNAKNITYFWQVGLTMFGVAAASSLALASGLGAGVVVPAAVTKLAATVSTAAVGTTGFGMCGVAGAKAYKRHGKRNRVGDLNDGIIVMKKTLRNAQVAVVFKFCRQVLQVPIEFMADDEERKDILKRLGVDISYLPAKIEEYTALLIQDRLQKFLDAHETVDAKQEQIARDFGLKIGEVRRLEISVPQSVMITTG